MLLYASSDSGMVNQINTQIVSVHVYPLIWFIVFFYICGCAYVEKIEEN